MNQKPIVQKVAVAAVIIKNDKVLILQRSKRDSFPNMWELPSGKKEPFETSENSLLREVKEETSLDIKIITPFYVFDYQVEKPEEIRDYTQINFLTISKGDNKGIKLSSEHQNFAWIDKDEVNQYELSNNTKQVIQKAFELIHKLS